MEAELNVLADAGLTHFYHIAPTHYVPMIGRDGSLKSKQRLLADGFDQAHFRSTSRSADIARGYGDVIHCTTTARPPLLDAKLSRGFPHIRIAIPVSDLPSQYDLSRFNIARGRYLKSGASPLQENARNGRYHDAYELPAARSKEEKRNLVSEARLDQPGVEILLHNEFALPAGARIECLSVFDHQLARHAVSELGLDIQVELVEYEAEYPNYAEYRQAVQEFSQRALAEPGWKGNGLEYDRLP